MPRQWTDTQRAEASKRALFQQPWKKSTRPRTIAGKAKSCMNALKHGQFSRQAYEFRAALSRKIAYLKFICHRADEVFCFQRNELITHRKANQRKND